MCNPEHRIEELEVRFHREVYDAVVEASNGNKYSDKIHLHVTQIDPYTMIELYIKHEDKWYGAISFAKANPNFDEFDGEFGIDLCVDRCVKAIAKFIVTGYQGKKGLLRSIVFSPDLAMMKMRSVTDMIRVAREGYDDATSVLHET